MTGFFASGHAADLILVILGLELAWLIASGRLMPLDAIGLALPGILIVAGLRAALIGADWWWIAAPLALALPFHLLDVRRRLANRRR